MARGTARLLTRHWARWALVASAIALTAATLSRCSPVLQEAQGADAWSPVGGVSGWGWFFVVLGVLCDLAHYAGGGVTSRRRYQPAT